MPDIVIKCSVFGRPVPTGLTTEMIIFESMPKDLPLDLNCPACRKVHRWLPRDAWVAGDGTHNGPAAPRRR